MEDDDLVSDEMNQDQSPGEPEEDKEDEEESSEVDIDTNIESKRDKAISNLLQKEDLGLI